MSLLAYLLLPSVTQLRCQVLLRQQNLGANFCHDIKLECNLHHVGMPRMNIHCASRSTELLLATWPFLILGPFLNLVWSYFSKAFPYRLIKHYDKLFHVFWKYFLIISSDWIFQVLHIPWAIAKPMPRQSWLPKKKEKKKRKEKQRKNKDGQTKKKWNILKHM